MIVCAALQVSLRNTPNKVFTVGGVRHKDCYITLENAGLHFPDYNVLQEGFLSHKGIFLSRPAAFCHAYETGQISSSLIKYKLDKGEHDLFSDDLW